MIDVQEGSDRQFVTGAEKSQIAKVEGLETTVGNAESGLVKGVADNKKAIADEATARSQADTALSNAIGQKVDKVDGKELIDTTKIQKLDGIEAGAQVNVIEKISVNGVDVSIDENKRAIISGLATSSDLGLLQGRVATIEGKDLVDTAQIKKSEGIAAGAQVNGIEKISVNGVDVTIDENKKAIISDLATASNLSLLQGRVYTIEGKEAD